MTTTIPEWTVHTHCEEYELGGSFSILLFFFKLPNVPDDPSKWPLDSHDIGAFHAMVDYPPEEGNEDRFISVASIKRAKSRICRAAPDEKSVLGSDEDGTVPDLSSFPSLEVMVMATPLTFYPGSEYPEAGEPVLYPEITRGKPGGAKRLTFLL
ncbi:hypothetical protein FS842_011406 [Serendipita sp. 407]|nr:hypothetical protein FS842_011406 [Serendipita sp. 407]